MDAYIPDHTADAGDILNAAGQVIGTYHAAYRFRQKPGEYVRIHALIGGVEYAGTKFERSRKGQVSLESDPFGDPICDCAERRQQLDDWRHSASYRKQMEEARYYLRGERF